MGESSTPADSGKGPAGYRRDTVDVVVFLSNEFTRLAGSEITMHNQTLRLLHEYDPYWVPLIAEKPEDVCPWLIPAWQKRREFLDLAKGLARQVAPSAGSASADEPESRGEGDGVIKLPFILQDQYKAGLSSQFSQVLRSLELAQEALEAYIDRLFQHKTSCLERFERSNRGHAAFEWYQRYQCDLVVRLAPSDPRKYCVNHYLAMGRFVAWVIGANPKLKALRKSSVKVRKASEMKRFIPAGWRGPDKMDHPFDPYLGPLPYITCDQKGRFVAVAGDDGKDEDRQQSSATPFATTDSVLPASQEEKDGSGQPVAQQEQAGALAASQKRRLEQLTMMAVGGTFEPATASAIKAIVENIYKHLAFFRQTLSKEECSRIDTLMQRLLETFGTVTKDELPKYMTIFKRLDERVIFPFLRQHSLVTPGEVPDLFQRAAAWLDSESPCREQQNDALLSLVFRRMCGDASARYPLLVGTAGIGKTYIAQNLAKALSAAGINTAVVLQTLTSNHGPNGREGIEMALLGSEAHYANGRPGKLFNNCILPDNKLVLVVLDEVDKCPSLNDFLLYLLDPNQPLCDTFIDSILPEVDLRYKVQFVLTANSIDVITMNAPLFSRLQPLAFPVYSREEIRRILLSMGCAQAQTAYKISKEVCEPWVDQIVDTHYREDISPRYYFDLLGEVLFHREVRQCTDYQLPAVPADRKKGRIGMI